MLSLIELYMTWTNPEGNPPLDETSSTFGSEQIGLNGWTALLKILFTN